MSPLLKRNSEQDAKRKLLCYCGFSGLLAGLTMCIVFLIHDQTVLGGSTTLLRVDLYHQYGPLFAEYYDRITGGQSLVYSWTSGLGSSFLGNLFNYLASPSAVVMFLLGHENMPEGIALMLLIKTIVASASFTYFLNKSNRNVNMMSIAFGILYAFSGYIVSYFWNVMWLDAVAVFPLVMLGIENIIQRGKPQLYTLSLAFIMLTNYYMAYIVCILSVCYFIYYFFGNYGFSSLLHEEAVMPACEEAPAMIASGEQDSADTAEAAAPVPEEAPAQDAAPVIEDAPVQEEAPVQEDIPVQEDVTVACENVAEENGTPVMAVFDVSDETAVNKPAEEAVAQPAVQPAAENEPVQKVKKFSFRRFCTNPAVIMSLSAIITLLFSSTVVDKSDELLVLALFCLCFFIGCSLVFFILSRLLFKCKETFRTLRNNRFFASGVRFVIGSCIAAAIAAVVLLPVYYILQGSSATGGSFPKTFKSYFNIFDFLANHLASVEVTWRSSADDNIILPNVYCGIITIILIPVYLFSKTIPIRQKIATSIFLAFFVFCFSNNYAEFIWHGFHMPNDLPFRYSFGYCFLLLLIAYKAILRLNEVTGKMLLTTGIGLMAFIVLTQKDGQKNVETFDIVLSLVLAFAAVLILWIIRSGKYKQNYATYLLIGAIIVEVLVADVPNFVMAQSKNSYAGEYDDYQSISAEAEKDETAPFYRTELTALRARMDPSWYGYNGVSVFSSMAYESVAKLMDRVGMYGNGINSYSYSPQTAVFNSMFSLKYLYDNASALNNPQLYSYLTSEYSVAPDTADGKGKSTKVYDAYKYKYWLPLAYITNGELETWDINKDANPFAVQNSYMELSTGVKDVLASVAPERISRKNNVAAISDDAVRNGSFTATVQATADESSVAVEFIMPEDGNFYVYAKNSSIDSVTVSGSGFSHTQSGGSQTCIVDGGYQKKKSVVTVELKIKKDTTSAPITIFGSQLDIDKFEKAYNKISENGLLNITKFDETYIEGTVNVGITDALLYTSIPMDKSWTVKVDGADVPEDRIVTVGGALLAVKLPQGEHTVSFTYNARGLSIGAVGTGAGIVLFAAYTALQVLIDKKRNGRFIFLPINNENF